MKRKDNYTFLTEAPEHKVIFVMALPAIISMLVTSLYNIVTTFYVGQIDTQATAAVGIVFPVMSVIQAVGMTFGQGAGNYMSRELGAKHNDNAGRMATTSLLLAVSTGVIIAVGGLLFLHDLSLMLGSTSTILPYTESYLSYVLLAAPFMTGALCLNNQMRFQGNASFAMFGIIVGALVNVILAPILIFVFDMGITGAGISTLAGEVCSLLLLLSLDAKGGGFSLRFSDITLTSSLFKEIMAGGTPSLTRQGMLSIGITMLNVAAGAFGDAAIAAMSIVSRIVFVFFASLIGFGQGFQPMCGYCFGAGLYSRVRRGYWFIVRTGVLFMLVVMLFGYMFSGECISVFRNDPAVIEIGTVALRWQLITLPLGVVVMYTNMMMQTIRKPWQANILSSARNGLFFIPLIVILPHFFGLLGVQMCQAWADVLSFLLAVPIAVNGLNNLGR